MHRQIAIFAIAFGLFGAVGCAGTWDTLTSRKFRQKPIETMFHSDDPVTVLRTSPEGDERAKAMRRLKDSDLVGPKRAEVVALLATAATTDPSPVVRVAAVDALGRMKDERAVGLLMNAYHQADGVPEGTAKMPKLDARRRNEDDPAMLAEKYNLRGPAGFPPDVAATIRSRTIDALAGTGRKEAVPLLMEVASGGTAEEPADRDARLAAVRGLGKVRTPESAVALAQVLSTEKGKDPALSGRAHEGLVDLTGQLLPPNPEMWNAFVRSPQMQIVPPPNVLQQVGGWLVQD